MLVDVRSEEVEEWMDEYWTGILNYEHCPPGNLRTWRLLSRDQLEAPLFMKLHTQIFHLYYSSVSKTSAVN